MNCVRACVRVRSFKYAHDGTRMPYTAFMLSSLVYRSNVVLQNLRIRAAAGDGQSMPAISVEQATNIVFDHLSVSWAKVRRTGTCAKGWRASVGSRARVARVVAIVGVQVCLNMHL